MKVNSVSSNFINTKSRKQSSAMQYTGTKHDIKHILPEDKDERYNKLGALGGLAVLVGLGAALVYETKFGFFKGKDGLKNFEKMVEHETKKEAYLKRGYKLYPYIDFEKNGKKAIDIAWKEHAQRINKNLKSHKKIEKAYEKLFSEESETLDMLENVARQRTISRGGVWK